MTHEVGDHLLDPLVRRRRLLEQQLPVAAHHERSHRRAAQLLDRVLGPPPAQGVAARHLATGAVGYGVVGVRAGVRGHQKRPGAARTGDQHVTPVPRRRPLAVQKHPVADLDQVMALVDDRLGRLGTQRVRYPGGHQPPVERTPPYGVVMHRQVGRGIGRRARAVHLGVRPQDPLTQPPRTAVDDENEVAGSEPETARVAGLEDCFATRQLDEVVTAADRPEALHVTGRNIGRHDGRGRVVGIPVGVERTVEVGELDGQSRRLGALELHREHGDAAADIGAHEERVQHFRHHGRTDRCALARMKIRHSGDVDHPVERGHLIALRECIGLDPTPRGREYGHRGGCGLRQGFVLKQNDAHFGN